MANGNSTNPADNSTSIFDARWNVAYIVLVFSLSAMTILGVAALITIGNVESAEKFEAAKDILSILLPVIGAWVGTVLAFYFGRENFESAARTTQNLVRQLTSDEKLRATPASSVMISIDKMDVLTLAGSGSAAGEEKVKIRQDMLEKVFKTRNRLPILDSNGLIRYIAHLSAVDKFIRDAVQSKKLEDLTLQDMLVIPANRDLIEGTVRTIVGSQSLAEVKTIMENVKDCQDVFITEDGTRQSKVLGWITNVILLEQAKV